ncbi:MAG TPA: retropepsin-like aspartic protease [Steroidobacteraceae bacterium]|nr:retropepsin-like aspartic protease [Steroidobacteraceae bacterium]
MNLRLLQCVLLASALAAPLHAQPTDSITGSPASATLADAETTLFATPTVRDRVGRIVAPVMVNDQGPFRFLVDTGANRSVLSEHMPSRLGLTLNGQDKVSLSGVTGDAIVPLAKVARVRAGALVLENLSMPIISATMGGLDGVLGVEGLADKRLVVDFANDRISIEKSSNKRAPREFVSLPGRFRHGLLLVVDVTVEGVATKAVIDTGAERSLGNERLRWAVQRMTNGDHVAGVANVEGVTADIQKGDMAFLPLIRFEGVEIQGVPIAYGDFNVFRLWDLQRVPALLVGMDILGTVDTMAIDYRRRELQLKPTESKTN